MSKITYRDTPTGSVKVYLDRQYVGSIVRNGPHYWHYHPKGSHRPGDSYNSIAEVKRSLEGDELSGDADEDLYVVGGETLVRPEKLKSWALIIRAIHQRGEDQANALAELDRRGLWLTEEQKVQAGLASWWPQGAGPPRVRPHVTPG